MQEQGDRPARPGRPSLLSTGPQAEPERQRILSSLEGNGAKPAAPKAGTAAAQPAQGKSRGLVWGALGLAALVVGAVGFALMRSGDDAASAPAMASAAPQHVPASVAAAPAPAAAPAAPATQLAAAEAEPSTAAVLNEMAEPPANPNANPLADLAPPARHAAATDGDAKAAARRKAEEKAERKAEQVRLAQQKAREQKAREQARPAKRADNDVVLLAALMAHIQPQSRKATPAEQLQVCKQYNAAGEAQCRLRVCEAAGAKEPACKPVPVAKLAPET